MRRYYGACVYAGIIDVIMIALFVWFKWIYEPRQWRARMDKRRARLERDVSMRDLQEMTPRESATVSHDFLAAGDGAATARHLDLARASKDVLEAGFRDCNKGLRIDLDFEGLGLTLPAPLSRTILRGVRGRIRPGRVTAVMGPSGAGEQGASESSTRRCQCREMSRRHHVTHRSLAGKTTFLSVLMGKVQRTCGELKINGSRAWACALPPSLHAAAAASVGHRAHADPLFAVRSRRHLPLQEDHRLRAPGAQGRGYPSEGSAAGFSTPCCCLYCRMTR